jgi:hypothetical protein
MGTVDGACGAAQACRSLRTLSRLVEMDRATRGPPSTMVGRMFNWGHRWVGAFKLLQAESLHQSWGATGDQGGMAREVSCLEHSH